MNRQPPYSKENEHKNNSKHSANRALPPSGELEGASGASFISHSLSLPLQSVSAVLTLLDEGCTIPFISRYRKERTGNLDEVQITNISELNDRLKELGKRKETILKTIREQEKLTPELEARIHACMDSTELEDIYLPYKPKRRTRAQIAREQGLEPLAMAIMEEAKNSTAPSNSPEGGREAPPNLPERGGVPMRTREKKGTLKEASPNPSEGRGVPMRTQEKKGTLNLPPHLSKVLASLSPPLSGRSGGALDIIAEIVSENQQARNTVRTAYQRGAVITSKVIKKMKDTDEAQKFADYFDFSEPLRRCNSHRLLAMRRGENQGILRVSITIDSEECISRLTRQFVRGHGVCQTLVTQAVEDSFKRLINPSIENEFAALSKERADEEAIKVFTENLRQLLLSPPLGQKRVLALDPGFANGCKIACLDEQGNLLHHEIIYPHPPRNQVSQATEALQRMISTYKIEAIAIGNGTASRESKEFVENSLTPLPPLRRERGREAPSSSPEGGREATPNPSERRGVPIPPRLSKELASLSPPPSGRSGGASIFLVSEDGASIYSASPVAREEFPDEDVTTRGAISIGRRLMDPLAELVKIDPKSIGVGQYQHDVDQSKLKHSLDQTVMSCVNQVGVNLNTASRHLLTYVSGLGPALAQNIVDYRREHGPFTSRAQLKKVKRLGDTAFQQCAGFLRIPNAKNPLDNSAVHPESNHIVEQMAKDLRCTIKDLIGNKKLLAEIDVKRYLTPHPPLRKERGSAGNGSLKDGDKLKKSLPSCERIGTPLLSEGLGEVSLHDILTELEKPGRDPRGEVEVFEFDKNVHTLNDLIVRMELPGIVTNITNFGVFVDIGVHQDGLVHISQLSDRFVTDPTQVVRLHQHVRVRVVEVDMRRKRIGLSMKNIKQ